MSFDNFRRLDPATADLERELIGEGDRQNSAFLPFVNAWMGFNGWMESVTDVTSDAAMITALADNRRMTDVYPGCHTQRWLGLRMSEREGDGKSAP